MFFIKPNIYFSHSKCFFCETILNLCVKHASIPTKSVLSPGCQCNKCLCEREMGKKYKFSLVSEKVSKGLNVVYSSKCSVKLLRMKVSSLLVRTLIHSLGFKIGLSVKTLKLQIYLLTDDCIFFMISRDIIFISFLKGISFQKR